MNSETMYSYSLNKFAIENKLAVHKRINNFQQFLDKMDSNGIESLFKILDEWFLNELTGPIAQDQLYDLQNLHLHFNYTMYISSISGWWSLLYLNHLTNPFLKQILLITGV
jgi:hypothetical protein